MEPPRHAADGPKEPWHANWHRSYSAGSPRPTGATARGSAAAGAAARRLCRRDAVLHGRTARARKMLAQHEVTALPATGQRFLKGEDGND